MCLLKSLRMPVGQDEFLHANTNPHYGNSEQKGGQCKHSLVLILHSGSRSEDKKKKTFYTFDL